MHPKQSAYETYRNGLWFLLIIPLVSTVNLLLDCFSVKLVFPFSSYLTRFLLAYSRSHEGLPFSVAVVFACVLLLVLFACRVIAESSDRFHAMRTGLLLYAADCLVYFIDEVQTIAASGFGVAHVIEFVIRGWILLTLYRADRVFTDPERKNKSARPKQTKRQEPPPEEEQDEEDDEGIQW